MPSKSLRRGNERVLKPNRDSMEGCFKGNIEDTTEGVASSIELLKEEIDVRGDGIPIRQGIVLIIFQEADIVLPFPNHG